MSRVVVLELLQALKFKSPIPDTNLLLLVQVVCFPVCFEDRGELRRCTKHTKNIHLFLFLISLYVSTLEPGFLSLPFSKNTWFHHYLGWAAHYTKFSDDLLLILIVKNHLCFFVLVHNSCYGVFKAVPQWAAGLYCRHAHFDEIKGLVYSKQQDKIKIFISCYCYVLETTADSEQNSETVPNVHIILSLI